MKAQIKIFNSTRKLIYGSVRGLSVEQMLVQPDGFDNNIMWNLGHVLVSTSGMINRCLGLPSLVTRDMVHMYKPGTTPSDWESEPDWPTIKGMLRAQCEELAQYEADGKLAGDYHQIQITTGQFLTTIDEAMAFNSFHEGIHLGAILSLRDFVK